MMKAVSNRIARLGQPLLRYIDAQERLRESVSEGTNSGFEMARNRCSFLATRLRIVHNKRIVQSHRRGALRGKGEQHYC